jgi:hypothetical protein
MFEFSHQYHFVLCVGLCLLHRFMKWGSEWAVFRGSPREIAFVRARVGRDDHVVLWEGWSLWSNYFTLLNSQRLYHPIFGLLLKHQNRRAGALDLKPT